LRLVVATGIRGRLSKMASTGIVDGTTTTLKCSIHNFETADPAAYEEHMRKEEGHYVSGYTVCFVCGKQIDLNPEDRSIQYKHVALGKAMHPACKEEFMK